MNEWKYYCACAHNILRHKGFLVQFWSYNTIYMFQASQDKCTIFSHQGWCYACCYGMSIFEIVFWERPKESNGSIINVIKISAKAKVLLFFSNSLTCHIWRTTRRSWHDLWHRFTQILEETKGRSFFMHDFKERNIRFSSKKAYR